MKKVVIVCLLAAAVSMAQKQRVVVLPAIADPETKLNARELDVLTEKLRGYASDVLPLADFVLLKQDYVKEKLGDEALFEACKEGTCVGDLIAMVQADFGARCEVFSVNGKLWLKFELYGTLRGDDEAGTISTFSESVEDLKAMEIAIEKKVPDAFRKILPEPSTVAQMPPPPPPSPPAKDELITGNTGDLEKAVDIELGYREPEMKIDSQVGAEKESNKSFWAALPLDIAGVALIGYGYAMNGEMVNKRDEYRSLDSRGATSSEFGDARQKVEDAKTKRNISYILGSIVLATGIGVHIWF